MLGQSPRAGRFAGFSSARMVFFAFLLSGGLAGLAGISEVSGADRPAAAGHLARLRLHRHHRRLPRPAQSARHRRGRAGAGADLSRRRGGAERARRLRQGGARLPGHAAVLRARLRHADPLPHPPSSACRGQAGGSGAWACREHPSHHRHRGDAAAHRGDRRARRRTFRRAQSRRRGHDGHGRASRLRRGPRHRLAAGSASSRRSSSARCSRCCSAF